MKKHYVLPNNVHDTEAGMPEYCMFYDSAEVDARIAELEQQLLARGGHNSDCPVSWKGECYCGWEEMKKSLMVSE